jgi:hypothetical protein
MSGKIKSFNMAEAGTVSAKADLKATHTVAGNKRADEYAPVKTSGVKTRGNGAAIKGTMARGPMA